MKRIWQSLGLILGLLIHGLCLAQTQGWIWRWGVEVGQGTDAPYKWINIDRDKNTVGITSFNENAVAKLNADGSIWINKFHHMFPSWIKIDSNPNTVAILGDPNDYNLYQLHRDGKIWVYRWLGCPNPFDCVPKWERLDNNPNTVTLAVSPNQLYQLHRDGKIWRREFFANWVLMDKNPKTIAIASTPTGLYQLHNDGKVWRNTNAPCNPLCNNWILLSDDTNNVAIGGGTQFTIIKRDGTVWQQDKAGNPVTWRRLSSAVGTKKVASGYYKALSITENAQLWGTTSKAQLLDTFVLFDANSATRDFVIAGGPMHATNYFLQLHGPKIERPQGRIYCDICTRP